MDNNLAEIVALARRQVALEVLVEQAEAGLADLKALLKAVSEEDLPMAMKEAGLKKFTLEDGAVVDVKEDYTCGVAAPDRETAWAWLEKRDYGGLIKTVVSVPFGKGGLADARALLLRLEKLKLQGTLHRDVHYQTLKAFVNERMKDPKTARGFPLELFGARQQNKSKIILPKAAK